MLNAANGIGIVYARYPPPFNPEGLFQNLITPMQLFYSPPSRTPPLLQGLLLNVSPLVFWRLKYCNTWL